jgi:hypothetical protein
MLRTLCYAAVLMDAAGVVAQQGQSPMPVLPPDIPKQAALRVVLMDGKPAGQDAVWKTPEGSCTSSFNSTIAGAARSSL